jgi:serine/threonine protein phosphatase 1
VIRLAESVVHHRSPGPAAVIGDIHGSADLLEGLLERIGDRDLICAGDLVDRGPESRQVLDLLVARGAHGVLGNHDCWFLDWAQGQPFDPFALSEAMGGQATLASYGVEGHAPKAIEAQRDRVPAAHRELLEGFGIVMDLEVGGVQWWVVHAGVPPRLLKNWMVLEEALPFLAVTNPLPLLWTKTWPEDVPILDRPLIMGHLPLKEPVDLGHVVAIDTGAGRGGPLTALLLPERTLVSFGP